MSTPMTDPDLHMDGPNAPAITFALAHGAGAPMDSPFMASFAAGLAEHGLRVVRFEFPYMAARRADGRKRGPDRQPVMLECWRSVIRMLGPERLVIGGKSMGGRMASYVADEAGVRGLACLGYPFHPPGRLDKLRTEHLETIATPTLILQGSRDIFGTREEIAGFALSPAIRLHYLDDGDHSFKPRKASGRTEQQNWQEAIDALAAFCLSL